MNISVEPGLDREEHLRSAVEAADISPLLMVLAHFTQDENILEELRPYIHGPWDYLTQVPSELQRKVRTRILPILQDHIAGRIEDPPVPGDEFLQKMMSVGAGQPVSQPYVEMMRHQLAFGGGDTKKVPWRQPGAKEAAKNFKVAVIGAGMSGICNSIKLKEAGISFTVYEKNEDVGGTWLENQYPGCGVDTPNHAYSFSFEPNHEWSRYFSKRDELYAYFRSCAEKYEILKSIRFQTEVVSAHYDDSRPIWIVKSRDSSGVVSISEFNAIIFAVGLLNRPSIPDIPGLDKFAGTVVHTADWNIGRAYSGQRVAMIGTGASGVQVGPTIAPDVEHLVIFQRSPHWLMPHPNYHSEVSEGKKWALKCIPYYAKWYRFLLFWASADSVHASLHVDPDWKTPDRSLNETNERLRQQLLAHIEKELGDRADLLEKVIPDYPPYGKRMLRDNNWYTTLKRDNVELVTDPIAEVREDGIVTSAGNFYPVDMIVTATGFSVGPVLAPVDIRGRDGRNIRDIWGDDDPRAYYGITVPNFPNLFIMYGPNTNLAHGGSALFHTECQSNYALQGLRELIESGYQSMECRQNVHDSYNERVDDAHSKMVWAHGGVGSWYKNKKGRVFATTPWRMVDYWHWTAALDPADYVWVNKNMP
jgi:4-hydroxyacetophenone monooxygenase